MVSIIVPIYNSEKTIDRCVQSIIGQTYQDLQIILVNDGSTDNSIEKCNAWANIDHRIVVLSKHNGGVSSARNMGMERAQGEYVGFVDSDDIIMPSYVEKLLTMIRNNQADMAICKAKKTVDEPTGSYETHVYNTEQMLDNLLYGKISTGVCGLLVATQIIKCNDLKFAEGYRYSEDLHMVWRLANYSKLTAYTKERHYVYFETQGSAMSKFNSMRRDSLKLFDDLASFFGTQRPQFARRFAKYGVSKNYWSYFWQAAVKLDKKAYMTEMKDLSARKHFVKLITYPAAKISCSALCGIVSFGLFRILAKKFGGKYLH